jgi:hypothetical protein
MASTSDVNNDELQKLYGNDVFRCEALRNHRGTGKGRKYLGMNYHNRISVSFQRENVSFVLGFAVNH